MLSLQVSRSGHGQQLLAVSRRSGWLPLSLWQKQRKNLSRCGKPHKGAGMGFFSGAWITEHPPTKVICWVNAHCRTGCIRRGRKRRKKSGLRSSLDTFGSSPGSVPLGRASSLYYKQKYMQQLQLVISNLLNSQKCRGDIKFLTFFGNILIWVEVAVSFRMRLGTISALQQPLCQRRDQATGFWGYFSMLRHSSTLVLQCGRPSESFFCPMHNCICRIS